LKKIFEDVTFSAFTTINVLPLIYNEKRQRCNIMVFDHAKARAATARIALVPAGGRRKHPAYRFYDAQGAYLCEVRYGGAAANPLQRGLWTHTKNGLKYFDSITGWISYAHNHILVALFSHALVSSEAGHISALEKIKEDIVLLKERAGLNK
jgi:hypothetical protein